MRRFVKVAPCPVNSSSAGAASSASGLDVDVDIVRLTGVHLLSRMGRRKKEYE